MTKKVLLGLLGVVSFNAFALVGDDVLTYNVQNLYKKFNAELSDHKLPNRVTTSVELFNSQNQSINQKLSNIDSIHATIGSNGTTWSTFDFEYTLGKDDSLRERVLLSYIKTKQMPLGGYVQDEDVNSDAILSSLAQVKSMSSKYTSNNLIGIRVTRIFDASGADVLYGYKFNKKDQCYLDTFSTKNKIIIKIDEVDCNN